MKKLLNYALYGIPTGVFIGLCISVYQSWKVGNGVYYPAPPAFIERYATSLGAMTSSIAIWGGIGMMFSISSLLFEKDDWSILKQTSVHFLFTYIGLLLINYLSNWFDYSVQDILNYTFIFIGMYVAIWSYSMLHTKKNLDAINQKLKKRGEENND